MFYNRYIKVPFYNCFYNKMPKSKPALAPSPIPSPTQELTSTHINIEENTPKPISESIEDELIVTRKTSHSDINNTHEISLHTISISKNIDPSYIEQTN